MMLFLGRLNCNNNIYAMNFNYNDDVQGNVLQNGYLIKKESSNNKDKQQKEGLLLNYYMKKRAQMLEEAQKLQKVECDFNELLNSRKTEYGVVSKDVVEDIDTSVYFSLRDLHLNKSEEKKFEEKEELFKNFNKQLQDCIFFPKSNVKKGIWPQIRSDHLKFVYNKLFDLVCEVWKICSKFFKCQHILSPTVKNNRTEVNNVIENFNEQCMQVLFCNSVASDLSSYIRNSCIKPSVDDRLLNFNKFIKIVSNTASVLEKSIESFKTFEEKNPDFKNMILDKIKKKIKLILQCNFLGKVKTVLIPYLNIFFKNTDKELRQELFFREIERDVKNGTIEKSKKRLINIDLNEEEVEFDLLTQFFEKVKEKLQIALEEEIFRGTKIEKGIRQELFDEFIEIVKEKLQKQLKVEPLEEVKEKLEKFLQNENVEEEKKQKQVQDNYCKEFNKVFNWNQLSFSSEDEDSEYLNRYYSYLNNKRDI